MASAIGAGTGADMLQEVLRRKFTEAIAQQKLAEEIRQANMQNQIQQGQLGLGNRRVDEDVREFDANAPIRQATVGRMGAETEDLNRRPMEAQKTRDFTSGESEKTRTFQGGQGDLNRGNAVRIASINGQNMLNVARENNATRVDLAGQKAAQKDANEVADTISLIDQIKQDPSLKNAVGPIDQYAGGVVNADPAGVNRFRALHNQLVGKMSLAQAGKLKGQGQISDKERAMLAAAATALSQGMSEQDYLSELAKVRDQFARMQPGAPAAAPAHGGSGFRVVEIK